MQLRETGYAGHSQTNYLTITGSIGR